MASVVFNLIVCLTWLYLLVEQNVIARQWININVRVDDRFNLSEYRDLIDALVITVVMSMIIWNITDNRLIPFSWFLSTVDEKREFRHSV